MQVVRIVLTAKPLCMPMATKGRWRIGRRRGVVIWAFVAVPANAGQRRHALLIAREIAGGCTDRPEICAPWIAGWRLRRCGLDFAKQRRGEHNKREYL